MRRTAKGDSYALIFPLLMIAGIVMVFFLWGGLDEFAVRFLTTRTQQLHIWRMTLWPSVGALVVGLVVWNVRSASGAFDTEWWKKVAQWIFLELFAALMLSMVLDSAIRIVLHREANVAQTLHGHVDRAGVSRSSKGTDVRNYAYVVTDAGEDFYVSSHRSMFTWATRNVVRANGVCGLDTLPQGYPVVLRGRRSGYGFALDAVTSDVACPK